MSSKGKGVWLGNEVSIFERVFIQKFPKKQSEKKHNKKKVKIS